MKATVNYGPVGVLVISAEQPRYGYTKYFRVNVNIRISVDDNMHIH